MPKDWHFVRDALSGGQFRPLSGSENEASGFLDGAEKREMKPFTP